MKSYGTEWIRNVGIAGHGDTGKTQLVSSLLFTAGMTPRLGKVAEGVHYGTYTIKGIKEYLAQRRIPVRLVW